MSSHFQQNATRQRHQLLFEDDRPETECGSIKNIEELHSHLQTAIEIEHSTIPTYLCALYSIKDGTNTFAMQTIQGVVMEEMLHMIQAANILNAVGGHPAINKPRFVPNYPTYLPHSDDAFLVPLQKFSKDAIDVFLQIEQPAKRLAPPEAHDYKTIGQFYHAVRHGLVYLERTTKGGIFTGKPERQVTPHHYYGGGGKLVAVHNLADAILGINEIVGQGEGMNGSIIDPDHRLFGQDIEYAHYYRFNEIRHERQYVPTDTPQEPPSGPLVAVEWAEAYNMQPNPKMANYPKGSELWNKTYAFNLTYKSLLDSLHHACNGHPELLMQSIPLMYDLKYKALELMKTPLDSNQPDGQTAGPSFEFVE
jgi:hypothetical protein